MTIETSAEIYQKKRAKFVPIIRVCFCIFAFVVIFHFFSDVEHVWMFGLAFSAVAVAIYNQMKVNTCPKCGAAQFVYFKLKSKLVRSQYWDLNPTKCPLCNEQLK